VKGCCESLIEKLEGIARIACFLAEFAASGNEVDENFGLWRGAMPLWRVTSNSWRVECVFLRGMMEVKFLVCLCRSNCDTHIFWPKRRNFFDRPHF
jgi:hypothetical protein